MMTRSIVWKTKLLSTFLFISGIWMVTQTLASGNIGISKGYKPDAISFTCAFFDCNDDNRFDPWIDWPELGTWIWIATSAVVIGMMFRRSAAHHR